MYKITGCPGSKTKYINPVYKGLGIYFSLKLKYTKYTYFTGKNYRGAIKKLLYVLDRRLLLLYLLLLVKGIIIDGEA